MQVSPKVPVFKATVAVAPPPLASWQLRTLGTRENLQETIKRMAMPSKNKIKGLAGSSSIVNCT